MKILLACIVLVLTLNVKAEDIESKFRWNTLSDHGDVAILHGKKIEPVFTLFNLSTQKHYPIKNLATDEKYEITKVDFMGKEPYLKVSGNFLGKKFRSFSGVVDFKGNWVIKPFDFSVSYVMSLYALGDSSDGTLEIRNLQDVVIRSFPRERYCRVDKLEFNIVFHCENPSKIIRLDVNDKLNPFTEFEFSGEYVKTNSDARLFVMTENNKIILYSESRDKLYEFSAAKGIEFYTDKMFILYPLNVGTQDLYHLDRGLIKTGLIYQIKMFGTRCIKLEVTLDNIKSTHVIDDLANLHDITEDVTDLCGVILVENKSEKNITPELKPIKTDADLCGYQNINGEWQIAPEFTSCGKFIDQVAVIRYQSVYGVINQQGQWITEKPVKRSFIVKEWDARDVSRINSGVINKQGQWVIPPMLNDTQSYLTDHGIYSCAFKTVSGCYRLNFSGDIEPVAAQEMDQLKTAKENMPKVELIEDKFQPAAINNLWGYQTATGKWLIPPKYAEAEHFKRGVAKVAQRNSDNELVWGFVDETGHEVIVPQYQEIQDFYKEEVTWFKNDDKWGLINLKGLEIMAPQFIDVKPFISDLGIAWIERWILVDLKGEIIQSDESVPERIDPFENNAQYARAVIGNYWGYIDRNGKWLSQLDFKSASLFVGDYAFVGVDDYDYRSGELKFIWQPPETEKSTYVIQYVKQIQNYSVLEVKIIQGTKTSIGLINSASGEWIDIE